MTPANRRVEKLCIDALLSSDRVAEHFKRTSVFQGFVAPNTLASLERYILLKRVDSISLDRVSDGTKTNKLRKVRLQVDIADVNYTGMVDMSEMVMDVLETAFPSSVDGDTYGTVSAGQKIFNVCSVDLILYETEV